MGDPNLTVNADAAGPTAQRSAAEYADMLAEKLAESPADADKSLDNQLAQAKQSLAAQQQREAAAAAEEERFTRALTPAEIASMTTVEIIRHSIERTARQREAKQAEINKINSQLK